MDSDLLRCVPDSLPHDVRSARCRGEHDWTKASAKGEGLGVPSTSGGDLAGGQVADHPWPMVDVDRSPDHRADVGVRVRRHHPAMGGDWSRFRFPSQEAETETSSPLAGKAPCKSVGYAYAGSNPAAATARETAPDQQVWSGAVYFGDRCGSPLFPVVLRSFGHAAGTRKLVPLVLRHLGAGRRGEVVAKFVGMAVFAAFAVFGLAVIRDFRGLRSDFAKEYPVGSRDWKRAHRSSLVPAWMFVAMGCAGLISMILSLAGVYKRGG